MRIRYYCHAGQETGYGRAATELALALLEAGVDLTIHPLNPNFSSFSSGPQQRLAEHVRDLVDTFDAASGPCDACLVHTMPLDCEKVLKQYSATTGAPTIAYTTWEGITVPSTVEVALGDFDDVWVPSEATREAFLNEVEPPISPFVLPHTFRPYERVRHQGEHLDGPFTFYYVGAWTARKNVHGLIRTFAHAFEPTEPVQLLLHSPGVSREQLIAAMVQTGFEQREMPKIVLSNRTLSEQELWSMHEAMDCFVTATRGESWNLPAFEAMLAGRHIVAPGCMGHDDFLFEDPRAFVENREIEIYTSAVRVSSYEAPAMVDVIAEQTMSAGGMFTGRTQPTGIAYRVQGAQGLTSKTLWRDPSLPALASAMRDAFENHRSDLTLNYSPAERFGHEPVAQRALARIRSVLQKGSKTA